MNTIKRTLVAVVASVFAVAALAGQDGSRNDGKRSIRLSESAAVSGVTIQPGLYTLSWAREPGTEEVRISIRRGRNVLATGNGRWIESAQPSPYEALVYNGERGTNELVGILFEKSIDSIRVDAGGVHADAGQSKGIDTN